MESSPTESAPTDLVLEQAGQPPALALGSCSGLTVCNHGQTWRKCPWSWGIENMVTVESSAGLLVLCEIVEHIDGPMHGRIEVRPIDKAALEDCPNTRISPTEK